MTARMGADGPSFITCLTDDGYTIPGYFVAPRSFDWLYIRLKPADGTPMEIMAPAETAEQAMEVKRSAGVYAAQKGYTLPDY